MNVLPRVDIPLRITLNAIGHACIDICKHSPIDQLRSILDNIKSIYASREPWIGGDILPCSWRSMSLQCPSVGNIHSLVVRTETKAITLHESVRHAPYLPCARFEAVDLAREQRRWAKGLFVAVRGIGEPDVIVCVVDDYIVKGVELSAVETV